MSTAVYVKDNHKNIQIENVIVNMYFSAYVDMCVHNVFLLI